MREIRITNLKDHLTRWDREVVQAEGRLDSLRSTLKIAQDKADRAAESRVTTDAAKVVLEKVSSDRFDSVQASVSNLVTSGLQAVFGPRYVFVVEPKIERGRPSIDMWVNHDGENLDIVDGHGGGLAAVVSFLLRVVVVSLEGGKVLIADEPFSHLSAEYVPRMATFLRDLVDQTGIQMILVSHESALAEAADVAYRFVQGPAGVEARL